MDKMGFGSRLQLARLVCVWLGSIHLAVTVGLLFTWSFPAQIPFDP